MHTGNNEHLLPVNELGSLIWSQNYYFLKLQRFSKFFLLTETDGRIFNRRSPFSFLWLSASYSGAWSTVAVNHLRRSLKR
jgi:hypothetical protein